MVDLYSVAVFLMAIAPAIAAVFAWLNSYKRHGDACRWANINDQFKPFPLTADELRRCSTAAINAYASKKYGLPSKTERRWVARLSIDPDYRQVSIHQASGRDCFAADLVDSDITVIAIRGTCGIFDTLRDCLAFKVPAPIAGKAHAGFLGDAKFLFYDLRVRERIESAQKRGRRVVVAGHSLGAATAIELAAIAETESPKPIAAVVALCAPRSADAEHAKRLSSRLGNRLMRVINSRDFVCMVPPAWFGFRHVGQTHYFDRRGNYHPALTAGFRAADLIAACFADAMKGRFFRDLLGYHSAVRVVGLLFHSIDRFNLKVKDED